MNDDLLKVQELLKEVMIVSCAPLWLLLLDESISPDDSQTTQC